MTRLDVWPGDNQYDMINKAEAHDVTVDHQGSPEREVGKNYRETIKAVRV